MRRWEKSFNNYITLAIFHIRCCDDKIYKHKLSSNRTSICYGDTTLLKVDSDYKKLRWNTGDTTSTIIARQWGRYYCIGWNSCRADTQYVDIEPDCSCIDSFGIPKTLTLCGTESKTVTAKGSPTLRYQWSTGDTTARITVKEQGVYYITASNLCTTFLDTLVVTQKPIATPAEQSFEIVYPATVVLSACYESDRYRWLPTPEACGDCKQINVKPTKAITNYVVEVRSDDGCMDSCVYTIHTSGIYGTIYIPNAFSPNGDGQNDLLKIFTDNSRLINFQIYNRWGELVFSSDSQSPQWDGKYKNENAPSGIYTYQVQYIQGIETSVRSLKGSIMLIR